MFGKATRSRPQAPPGAAAAGADWSPYPRLEDAARVYFLHADVALEAIDGVLGRRRVRGFTLERVVDLTDAGTSVWQEAAVCDGRRLILWHSEELADDTAPGGTVLDSSVQVLPLDTIGHVGMRTLVGRDERGGRVDRGVHLVLATATPHELSAVAPEPGSALPASAKLRPEAFRFSKSLDDGGAGQIARLIAFGRLMGRLVPGV
ncbi:hypothetical protein VSR01_06125 [Actinacidiphila sp. DG2A-62]|jgi:hypothetical protein|uniref:hypothetical protein n=1 Tax=Actinacidiphila sp. DG2A-62 TaxID=3108821 RepID=UPI002DBE0C58|nr:hypothetical protein [Actinacidiphila sp. DG2A-62]MEC3993143.1 hypothetical protein [Actinacidiphila sp. DG2A-62]